jgi:hypothetical protein
LTAAVVTDLATLLTGYFKTLAGPLGDPSFEMTLYTCPNLAAKVLPGEWATISEDFHWHIEVVPEFNPGLGSVESTSTRLRQRKLPAGFASLVPLKR